MAENGNEENMQVSHIDISILPDELMYAVFRLFDAFDLLPFSRVCQRWRYLIDDPRLRKSLDLGTLPCTTFQNNHRQFIIRVLSNSPLLHTFKAISLDTSVNSFIPPLAKNCPHLSVLVLTSCEQISEESWQIIGAAPWPRLTHLSLHECAINNHILATILPTVSKLTVLGITAEACVKDEGILSITGHTPHLQCLMLGTLCNINTVPLLEAVGSNLTQLTFMSGDRALLAALPTVCVCLRVLALYLVDSPIDALTECLQKLTHLTHLHLEDISIGMYQDRKPIYVAPANTYNEASGLRKLEYLRWQSYHLNDKYLLEYIARKCGSCLRYLSIVQDDTSLGVLTDIFSLCPSIEHLEFKLKWKPPMSLTFDEVVSTLPNLRIFAIETQKEWLTAIKDHLAPMLPNVLICSMFDLHYRYQYERWRLPDIFWSVLQPDIIR